MSLKTILVHVDGSRHAPARYRLAASLAIDAGAHLIGSAMTGISRMIYTDAASGASLAGFAEFIDKMQADSRAAAEQFSAVCNGMAVPSFEQRLCQDEAEGGLVLQSRYADLVVVSQPDPEETLFALTGDLPEFVTLHGVRPVLVVPYAYTEPRCGTRAIVTWDGSSEAARAITAALPLLVRASQVTLVVANPQSGWDGHGPQPGDDMALYLARHGIKVEVLVRPSVTDVGADLLAIANDRQADLLVMGCYGHGRFREMLLGGASRTILNSMTLPVLMAH